MDFVEITEDGEIRIELPAGRRLVVHDKDVPFAGRATLDDGAATVPGDREGAMEWREEQGQFRP